MATSNRDRIGQLFEVLSPPLNAFIEQAVLPGLPTGTLSWTELMRAVDAVGTDREYHPGDPMLQLKLLSQNYVARYKRGWHPFKGVLTRVHEAYAGELLDVRNAWAHHKPFSDDDAYRALDTAERLLTAINAGGAAAEVERIRLNLRRVSSARDDRRTLTAVASENPDATGLRAWRHVLRPHDDVASGNFHASEFAADLFKVAGGEGGRDYADPVEFFNRTYLTDGLRDLIGRAVRRLSGDDNASPVVNLQTNFGGGKTHSMLSLWHLAGITSLGDFPQDVQVLLESAGYRALQEKGVRRVAIVGNHFAASGELKPDGTFVRTIWGELAWQLGGKEAYAVVADADASSTPPGAALHHLLAEYSPALILIDEWVAYARALYGVDPSDPATKVTGGSFDSQFTFAQSLTEAAKGTSGVFLAISIPASESGHDGEPGPGSAQEVGGAHGLEALKRLQNVVRRVADQWRPASADEAYHIVRQRLFVAPDAESLAAIDETAKGFVEMYRRQVDDFPRETRDAAYRERIKRTYPIHPELFDRLYEDWSSLERFQRTRGVLRLMNAVVHALWVGEDAGPLILPGSLPIATAVVNSELSQYLPDSWKAVIDTDVDGPNSEPARIDLARPQFGARSLTKRLARTVFFGSVPTIGSAHKGIETQRVFLGTAVPGDRTGDFHAALNALGDRATYFYSGQGKYWYDLQANITRTAKDQAERLHKEDVWAEIARRLSDQGRLRGAFAGVHVCPPDHADIPDTDEARLVILHPKVAHKRGATSAAKEFAQKATEHRGTANRTNRNMLVYLAADESRLEELDSATRDYLGWKHVLDNDADLDLTQNQRNQATQRKTQADQTVTSRLMQTFTWALVPAQPDPGAPFTIREIKVEGQSDSLAERVSRRLGNDGDLSARQAAATIRLAIGKLPKIWADGHVGIGTLWGLYSQYPYMPRLRDRRVLDEGIMDMPLMWQTDAFGLATGFDEDTERYVGLWTPDDKALAPQAVDSTLIVRPDLATKQRDAEIQARTDDSTSEPGVDAPSTPTEPRADPDVPNSKTRFYGVKTLDAGKIALDFKNIAEEVIAHLRADAHTTLTVRIEIEATDTTGFDEKKVRTVSENARTLKFDQSGFEDS